MSKVGLMLTNSPFVLSCEGSDRGCGEARKALCELIVDPHEEEVASETGEGGEETGGGLHEVRLGRGGGGQRGGGQGGGGGFYLKALRAHIKIKRGKDGTRHNRARVLYKLIATIMTSFVNLSEL